MKLQSLDTVQEIFLTVAALQCELHVELWGMVHIIILSQWRASLLMYQDLSYKFFCYLCLALCSSFSPIFTLEMPTEAPLDGQQNW